MSHPCLYIIPTRNIDLGVGVAMGLFTMRTMLVMKRFVMHLKFYALCHTSIV